MEVVTTHDGKIFHTRNEWPSDKLVINEAFQANVYQIHSLHFNNNNVFLDIGANIGARSVFVSTLAPQARIIAFEPQPDNFELLQKNVAENDTRVELDNRGVWHTAGKTKIHHGGGGSYIGDDGRDEIELVTLEQIFKEYKLDEVAVLKVDIEQQNAEKLLINTPIEVLKRCNYICVEFDGWLGSDKTLLGKLVAHLSPYFDVTYIGNEDSGGDLWATRKSQI